MDSRLLSGQEAARVSGQNESDWNNVNSGVPQGSVLGPILFILFINDLPDNLINKILLYADDSKLISVHNSPDSHIRTQAELDQLVNWANTWLMELNLEKCKVIYTGKSNPKVAYSMASPKDYRYIIDESNRERDLGVEFSSNLKWHFHFSTIAAKANRVLGTLQRTFKHRDINLWKMLYMALVRPHLEFASSVWNPTDKCDIDILEKAT